jgi:hypothetical protein
MVRVVRLVRFSYVQKDFGNEKMKKVKCSNGKEYLTNLTNHTKDEARLFAQAAG